MCEEKERLRAELSPKGESRTSLQSVLGVLRNIIHRRQQVEA